MDIGLRVASTLMFLSVCKVSPTDRKRMLHNLARDIDAELDKQEKKLEQFLNMKKLYGPNLRYHMNYDVR